MQQTETATSIIAADPIALAVAIPAVSYKLRRRLREEGGTADLTPSQVSAVRQLGILGSATVTELAGAEGVRPQSMGATIASLQAIGFVEGVPDPSDGRRTILSLSTVAVEKFSATRAARESWLFQAIQANLTIREQQELARGLEILERLVDR